MPPVLRFTGGLTPPLAGWETVYQLGYAYQGDAPGGRESPPSFTQSSLGTRGRGVYLNPPILPSLCRCEEHAMHRIIIGAVAASVVLSGCAMPQ